MTISDRKIVIIIQARMGSTRLPGKVMMPLQGKPVLKHVIDRTALSDRYDSIIVATTINEEDNVIAAFCEDEKIECFRGAESDVLDRFYQAAKIHGADVIVRITSDCPMISPTVINKVVDSFMDRAGELDFAANTIERTYPRGLDVEVVSFKCLEKLWKETLEDKHREHVTLFVYEHPEDFRIYNVRNEENISGMRWVLDEKADFLFINKIYEKIYNNKKDFTVKDVLNVLKASPGLLAINSNVVQKKS